MTIKIKQSGALTRAMDIVEDGGGETDELEVIEHLLDIVPPDTIFKRDGLADLSVERLRSVLNHNFDPR